LYGIRSCDSCRKARQWLEANTIAYRYHDLRDDGLDTSLLDRWTGRMDWESFLNKRSLTWRKIPEVDRAGMTRARAMSTMLEFPTLIKRPVLECDQFIAVGFSPDQYGKLLAEI
jgi:Spx/MgsR family transcriptional regulator